MLLPACVDAYAGNPDWKVFATSAATAFTIGVLIYLSTRPESLTFSFRESVLFVNIAWLAVALLSALPFYFSDLHPTFTDAWFESVSGLTTTGSTVLSHLDTAPPGLLLWRSLLQWIGGIGIVVLGIWLLPAIRVGGQQLFAIESSDQSEKPFSRIERYAANLLILYVILTISCAVLYVYFGMTVFDGINHALTTVSTGGFSTSDLSIGKYSSDPILWVAVLFMILSGLPFIYLLRLCLRQNTELDPQIKYFLTIGIGLIVAILVYRKLTGDPVTVHTITAVIFNVFSVLTTTGYASEDYTLWGGFAVCLFFAATFLGGCTGSTSGGLKMFRIVMARQALREAVARSLRPHQIINIRYGSRKVSDEIVASSLGFIFVFFATFAVFSVALSFTGLDAQSSLSASATAIANVGPGIGDMIGPAVNFSGLPIIDKWLLSVEMIVGRLELLSTYVLLLPGFWKPW